MGSLEWALILYGVFIRRGNLDIQRDTRDVCTHRKDDVKTQPEGNHWQAKEKVHRTKPVLPPEM